jgi:hypothetical protein
MKLKFSTWKIAFCALLLAGSSRGYSQVQIIRPGDFPDAAVENRLRQKCQKDWPEDFRMRVYCEKNRGNRRRR